jgi:hypothetical protein
VNDVSNKELPQQTMTTENEPPKPPKARKARNMNLPHRLEGKDLEMFMRIFNHVKDKDKGTQDEQDDSACMLWPKRMPNEVKPSKGYRVRIRANGYGIFHIGQDRPLSAHKVVYVNCHEANPEHKEVSVIDGELYQIRHRYCETPDSKYEVGKTTFVRYGGNPRCVNPLHLIPGSQDANRIDRIASMISQPAIDTINVRITTKLRESIASERVIPQLVVKKLGLNRKKLGYKSVDELRRDIAIIQIETFGEIIYPDGERSFALEHARKVKPKNAA